ncbi:PLP-dependent aminotransferase family protein [Chitinophaga sp. HK235]|uniref:aminotransferase-like domain-containing protein n=1 Tax=Chitinophaga sp. HK235 TaxID=2952571 RepID=UPI001BA89B37|nr:PLP-dependent aminotransferase family protein [Chitinophaga sp. HK235]
MLPFKTLLKLDKDTSTPLYQQISNQLTELILDSIIKPGATLPGTREMAVLLGVHRKTIVAAYQELEAQAWVEIEPRKNVTVAEKLPRINPRDFNKSKITSAYTRDTGFEVKKIIDFPALAPQSTEYRLVINDGFPDQRIAPIDLLLREYRSLFHSFSHRHTPNQSSPMGSLSLRSALVEYLSDSRGLNIDTNNILLTHGGQMAIYIAAKILLRPGSTVLVGEPNFFLANLIFEQFGAKLVKVPMDENGMKIDFIEQFCKTQKPDLLYIIPHHHHPTTVTLSTDRRIKLMDLIRKYHFPVIEDDYDYDFHYNGSPILPLASGNHGGNIIYIGSLTKSLTTSVRLGYMIAPGNFIQEAVLVRTILDYRNDYLFEGAFAALMQNGEMQKHIKKSVKLYRARRNRLCDQLQEQLGNVVSFAKPAGGLAVWVKFNEDFSLPEISKQVAINGMFMNDGEFYSYGTNHLNSLRFGFAGLNEKEIDETVAIIKNVTDKIGK